MCMTQDDIDTGVKCDAWKCPIARMMIRYGVEDVSVTRMGISGKFTGVRKLFLTPIHARDFMSSFDRNKHVTPINIILNNEVKYVA